MKQDVALPARVRRALAPAQEEIAALPLHTNAGMASELLGSREVSVLDIGCGDGKFTRALALRFASVKGIDVKESKIAQARAAAARESAMATFEVASGEAIPDADSSYDVVIFSNSLHHMPEPARALAEAVRVLKPQGTLYVMEPVPSGTYHEATRLVNDETVVRTQAYEALLTAAGLEEEREVLYRGRRCFDNFEEWKADQIDRDIRRKAAFEAQPEVVRERFLTHADRENGKLAFDQVFRINTLRKR